MVVKLISSLMLILLLGMPVRAETPVPASFANEVILTVSKGKDEVTFNLSDLDALPQYSFTTTTVWTEGEITFSGPTLRDLLDAAGLPKDAKFKAQALNDYSVHFDAAQISDHLPIVATRMNGKPFGPRNLGPLWIIYPFDSGPAYQTDDVFAQSLWQLTRIIADAPEG